MQVSAFEIGPARLRLAAEAAKHEALTLASEWGTPLARIPATVAEAFRSAFGDQACQLINGWERDLNGVGNQLFHLSSACEAAADEEEAVAHVVADGLPPPPRHQNLAAAFAAWEGRPRTRRGIDTSRAGANRFVSVDPDQIRHAARALLDASAEFDAARRRLEPAFSDVGLEAPEELRWVAEGSDRLAAELCRRAEAYERADEQARGAANAPLSGPFSSLLASAADAIAGAGDPRIHPMADVNRLLHELRPRGTFDLADFKKGRTLLADAERASAKDAGYAAAFLRSLGPKNLRWLIENGQLDPCALGAVVGRASQAGVGVDFLKKTIGSDRFDAPRRAALLSACPCPTAQFDPAWVEAMAVTLLTGRDPPGEGDPRRWYREAAANLLRTNPAGAVVFISAHRQLACQALFSHNDPGGKAGQVGVLDMVKDAPAGLHDAADDALEGVLVCAAQHEFTNEGKRSLAELVARPETYRKVTLQLLQGLPSDLAAAAGKGFSVGSEALQSVLSGLMVDDQARRTLVEGANRFAVGRLRSMLAAPDVAGAQRRLEEAGAALGALASRPYSLAATLDIQKMTASTAKDLVGAVRGAALNVAKAEPVVSLAIESGSAILFNAGDAVADQQRLSRDLMAQQDAAQRLSRLKGDLTNNLEHLTYVSVLADPRQRAALDLRLSPADLPAEVPGDLNVDVSTRPEWVRDLFDDQGRLIVPQPSDVGRWKSFLGWAETVNPRLADRVSELTRPMLDGFAQAART